MAGENPTYPTGNGDLIGRRTRRHRSGRDIMAIQHPRLRPATYARSKVLRDRHSRVDTSLRTATKDPTSRRHTLEDRLLLP